MRTRLTKRAAEDRTPFPGDLNLPDREKADPPMDKYDNWTPTLDHYIPDMRHEWKDNPRDAIGMGIPKKGYSASTLRVTASKAVRVAVLLLGDKVDDRTIARQARDLMPLGVTALDRTLKRFADTQSLYADEEVKAPVAPAAAPAPTPEAAPATPEAAPAAPAAPAPAAPAKTAKEEVKADDDDAAPAIDITVSAPAAPAEGDVVTPVAPVAPVETVVTEDAVAAPAEGGEDDDAIFDDDGVGEEVAIDAADEKLLTALFDKTEEESAPKACKAGIKKLGFQPKVASAQGGGDDLSSIWQSAPDVSELFQ